MPEPFNLVAHLARQQAFSRATFGPGERRAGVSDHIRKELAEVAAAGDAREAAEEWIDVVILALDGLTRALAAARPHGWQDVPAQACALIEAKQATNEQRSWPDWRTADPGRAIEHDRSRPDA